jgi:hypothetical protein
VARKYKGVHPSVVGGMPGHGDAWEEAPEDATNEELGEDGDEGVVEPRQKPDRIDLIEREMELLRRENAQLKRQIPPTPPRTADADEDEDETDWETLIFADPKGAAKKIEDRAVAKAEKNLRREYQSDQSSNKFWTDFYAANSDLKDEDDLVQLTLNTNLATLGDMPVDAAMSKLADLTRQRIMRYSNGGAKPRSGRAVAEGASAPSGRRAAAEPPRPKTLSDIIRVRKENRRKAASAV